MKKKITMLLTNAFDPDPRVFKEAQYLIEKGFKVIVLCWDKELSANPVKNLENGVGVIRYRIPAKPGSGIKQIVPFIRYIVACNKFLTINKCDYIHCHDLDGMIAGILSRKNNTPLVFDMHEFYESGNAIKGRIGRYITLYLLKKSVAGLYENTAYLKKPYSSVRNKLFELKNYPDPGMVEARKKSPSTILRIGYHGAVRSQETEFLALFEAVGNKDGISVEINGSGPDWEKIHEASYKYNNIVVNGAFDGTKDLPELYERTDVLFCGYNPALSNYQGDAEVVKFYEAIYTGTPMIMTENIGMGDKVAKYGYGITCDTRNPDAIFAAVNIMLDSKQRMIFSMNEFAHRDKYNWNQAVKVLDLIYN